MEEVIKKLIEIDEKAKNKINTIKQKEDNIEEEISAKLKAEKEKIDSQYILKRKNLKDKFEKTYQENCDRINTEKEEQISLLRQKYDADGKEIIDKIVHSIINVTN